MDDEALFLCLLLMHGGDPEPDLEHPTDVFNVWVREILVTLREWGLAADRYFDFLLWLQAHGLAYTYGENRNG